MINKIPHQIWWNYAVPFTNGVPQIKKQKVDFSDKKYVLINEVSKIKNKNHKDYVLLFFADDKFFNAYYKELFDEKRLGFLQSFYAISGLDFSTFPNIDEEENIHAIKKNRRFCTYCQQHDILCVYNAVWTGEQSYEIAFSNIEKESAVIISTYRISNKDNDNKVFRDGYLELKKRVSPPKIYCYGPAQKVMDEDIANGIVEFIPTRNRIVEKELQEKSGIQELFIDYV